MKCNKRCRLFFVLSFHLLSSAAIQAQYSFSDVENITATIQPVVGLTVVKNSTGSINFTSSSAYINGITISNFNTYKIKSNVPWTLSISSATAYFSASGSSSSNNMPAGVLGFSIGTLPTVYYLSTTSRQIASGTHGNELATGNTFNVNLAAKPNYDYGPGIYTIAITYTLTAQ